MREAPPTQLKAERHYDEAKAAAKQALDELTSLQHDLDDIVAKLPKAKQEAVRARVGRARQLIGDHMPWIVQMMHEHMDKVVGAAKYEIQAEIGRRLAGAGLQFDGEVGVGAHSLMLADASETRTCCQAAENGRSCSCKT